MVKRKVDRLRFICINCVDAGLNVLGEDGGVGKVHVSACRRGCGH